MKNIMITVSVLILSTLCLLGIVMAGGEEPFAPSVDLNTGSIRVPEGYTEWPVLGTWALANKDGKPGSGEFHVVYTQPQTIDHYRRTGGYPDGAVLVKELRNTKTMPMTTYSAVSHATDIKGWFILVRDTKGRYKDTGLWGDGWGWSFFNKEDPEHTVSKNYRNECIPCHIPARQLAPPDANEADKWTYSFGYSVLRKP